MSKEVTINSDNFDAEVINASVPVLLDFWAPWCGPCRMIAPFIEQIADEYEGRFKVCKINVDEQNELALRHTINSIPTLAVYKDGALVFTQSGALSKNEMENLIKKYL